MDKKDTKSTATTLPTTHMSTRPSRRQRAPVVQNFLVVWLDTNINEENNDCQNTITKLREVANAVNTFTDINECIGFITDIKIEKVFMISSGTLGQTTVPVVHDMAQISTIYIFCGDKTRHEQWAQQWPKIKGVFTNIKSICETLKTAVHECDQNSISMSFVAASDDGTNKNLDQLDQSFMYTQILKEILLTIDFEREDFMKFIIYCREQFLGNTAELKNVDKFEKQYCEQTPVWWYTYPCFLHSILNCALRTMEIDLIINLGFFIRDLHEHIVQLHSKQYISHNHPDSFVVYRGQGLSQPNFDQLMKTEGGLLSFNNFLSTSKSRHVSLNFARETIQNSDLVGILFVMVIDPSIPSTPFADVCDVSYYQTEEEILFSMHAIFRIRQIKQINKNNRLWQVDLTLTSDHDPQLHAITERIRQETFPKKKDGIDWDQTSDDREKADIYYHLGWTKNGQGEYMDAIAFYEKAVEIKKVFVRPDHTDLAVFYNNMGNTYEKMHDYAKALLFHKKALEINEKILPPNHPHLAISYNNIGLLYTHTGDYSKALQSQEKALEIKQKVLSPNDPSLATSYSNIGSTYAKMGVYSKALSYYEKDLEVSKKILPPNHPDLAVSYSNVGGIYSEMGNHSKALSFYERAFDIGQHSLPTNHPHLQVYKRNVENEKKKL